MAAKVRKKKKKQQNYVVVTENHPIRLTFTFRAWQIAKLGGINNFRDTIYTFANALLVAEEN